MFANKKAAVTLDERPSARVPGIILVVVGCTVLAGIVLARMSAEWKKSTCRANLENLAASIKNFRDAYGYLPPAIILDSDGKPMHSWRVLIVPFIEKNWFADMYNWREPWDSPHNQRLHRQFIIEDDGYGQRRDVTEVGRIYRCPGAPASQSATSTNYVMIVDTQAPPLVSADRRSGWGGVAYYPPSGGSIVVVEIANSDIHWMEPRDLSLGEMSMRINDSAEPGISSHHVGGAFVMMDNGTVSFLDESSTRERIKGMLKRSSGVKGVGELLNRFGDDPR